MQERSEMYYKLVQNALFVNGAGNPPAALVLLEEAIRIEPSQPLALSVKKQIEGSLLKWMSEQHKRTVSKALEEALACEQAGEADRARQLAQSVLALEPGQAQARGIVERAARQVTAA